ncbi:MAG: 50S ribosomal protein L30e [Candidatus Marsarchaeota archaeon]|nr:50S ribosomal protein L30e [Candidatus Marsarchaeota archaeon]
MPDLAGDIRLAVDSGKTALGFNSAIDSIRNSTAKLVIVASSGDQDSIREILHTAKIANVNVVKFEGNPVNLGAVCGKPFSVSVLSIIEPGNSSILETKRVENV